MINIIWNEFSPKVRGYKTHNSFHKYHMKWKCILDSKYMLKLSTFNSSYERKRRDLTRSRDKNSYTQMSEYVLILSIFARYTVSTLYILLVTMQKEEYFTIFFYNITVSLPNCWDKTNAQSEDMYEDDSGILSLVIKWFGITNILVQNFAVCISSLKTVPKSLRKMHILWANLLYM